MSHLQRNQSEPIDQLFQGILSLKSVEECYTFFSDLFTVQELTAFAQRFQVAGLLLDGNTYEMVCSWASWYVTCSWPFSSYSVF